LKQCVNILSTHVAQVRVFQSLPRRSVLALMKDAHVLFHPSPNESVGMVLVEAAAAGLAVVASKGPGLPQLHELFPAAGARSVDRGSGNQLEHERRFEAALEGCLRSWSRTRAIGLRNHRCASDGAISVLQRNEALASVYESTLHRQGTKPLCVADLVAGRSWTSSLINARRLQKIITDGWSKPTEPYFTLHPGPAWPSSRQQAGE
jgi:hypothetical protein